jgi:hypothetical protein
VLPTLGKNFQQVRRKNSSVEEKSNDFDTHILFLKCNLILIKLYQKMPFNKRGRIFFSVAEFMVTWPDYLEKKWQH